MDQNNNQKNNNNKQDKPHNGRFILIVIAAIIGTLLLNTLWQNLTKEPTKEVSFDEFIKMVDEGKVKEATFDTETITFKAADEDGKEKTYYTGTIDNYVTNDLVDQLEAKEIKISGEIPEEQNYLVTFLLEWILPILVMAALFLLVSRVLTKRMDGLGGIGQSKAKVYMEKETGVTFRDVAGQDEAKESLVEIIDFLHNPKKYTAIGAKLPKGALLVGSPGTGKTLLAKAVAGEAHVPFFSISGSDFVEMFVGVGASRVRDLFQQAAKVAPAIIFIDEIDAIGRSRDSRFGGNDEREQTLNQLLAEIDGFDSSKGVVILAATNRPEILDKALLRAGRFDRRIIVDRPNLEGRYQTLRVHTRNIKLAEDVDLHKLAQATAGAVGADLANLVNEAALRAVRLGRHTVNQEDLLTSFEVVIAGTEKKGTVLTDIEKRIVSYHEVGHALVAALQKNTKPVSKITIVPHTSGALGYTMQTPEEEKYLSTKQELLVELQTLLGGRAAEQTVFGVQTTGAANDIERATELARKMVMQFGMSEKIGLMNLASAGSEYLDDKAYMDCSQATASDADAEVRVLLDDSYKKACALLQEHRELLDEVALFLLQRETITGDELMTFVKKENEPQAEEAPEMPTAEAKENEE